MRWKRDPKVAWQTVGGEAIVLDVSSGKAVGLNPTGSFVWARLEDGDEVEIAREMAADFGVTEEAAAADVRAFLADLERRGLVTRADG